MLKYLFGLILTLVFITPATAQHRLPTNAKAPILVPSYQKKTGSYEAIIKRRAAELVWHQRCGGRQVIDFGAVAVINEQPDGADRLITELQRLRSQTSTMPKLKAMCARIQRKFDLTK